MSQKNTWGNCNFTPMFFSQVRWGSWSLEKSCRVFLLWSFVSLPEGIELFWQDTGTVSFPYSFHYSEFMFHLVFFPEALVKTRQRPLSKNHRDSKIPLLLLLFELLWSSFMFLPHVVQRAREKLQNCFFFVGYSYSRMTCSTSIASTQISSCTHSYM